MKKLIIFTLLLSLLLVSCGENAPAPSGTPVVVPEVLADGKTKADHIVREDKRITITSLEVWDEFNYDGNFSDNCLLFVRGFIEGYSEFLELGTVKLSYWEIIRDEKEYGYKMAFNFTVSESKLDTLPVGDYKTVVTDSVDCYIDFIEAPREKVSETVPHGDAESIIYDWLTLAQYYDYPDFGEWSGTQYAHYVRCHYGDKGVLEFSDFASLVKDKFGMTVEKEMFADGLYVEDMKLYINTAAPDENQAFDFVGEVTEDGITTVTVLHYADCNKLIGSYKMAYKIDADGRFIGCERIDGSPYKPYGLRGLK